MFQRVSSDVRRHVDEENPYWISFSDYHGRTTGDFHPGVCGVYYSASKKDALTLSRRLKN